MNALITNRNNSHRVALMTRCSPGTSKALPRHYVLKSVRPTRKNWQRSSKTRQSAPLSRIDRDCLLRQQSLAEARCGNTIAALAGLTRLIERNPHSAKDYNNRGLVYLQDGQLAPALADYNQALQLNPKLASVYNNRANYYAAQGQLAEAVMDYETAIDLDPTNVRAWINQGITFRDLDMLPQAIENFDQALYIQQLVRRCTKEATWLACHVYGQRGRTYELAGDWNCAIADYHTALTQIELSNGATGLDRLEAQVNEWLSELLCPLP